MFTAVFSESPVIIIIWTPPCSNCSMANLTFGLGGSFIPIKPVKVKSLIRSSVRGVDESDKVSLANPKTRKPSDAIEFAHSFIVAFWASVNFSVFLPFDFK
uniref:Uncharacterized protein n=1 Tax=Saccharomyces cerevisiae TaxID=4932 RepID=A2NXY6_YEASX|nr:unknown [Saccharomyces cerevisiae]